jgi:hypothetical protein
MVNVGAEQRVAVGLGRDHHLRADETAAARTVFDHDRPAPGLAELVGENARADIGR